METQSNLYDFAHNEKLDWDLRMLYVYTPSQKFDTIRISVFRDITKILKKSTILKMSKIYIYTIIRHEKLLTNY